MIIISMSILVFIVIFILFIILIMTTEAQVLRRSQRPGGAGEVQGPVARSESPGGLPAQPQGQGLFSRVLGLELGALRIGMGCGGLGLGVQGDA